MISLLRLLNATLVCCLCSLTQLHAVTFHVATNGNDANAGTAQKPFATLTAARDHVRQLKFRQFRQPITVIVHGGTYSLSQTLDFSAKDSGTTKNPIVWQAAPGEGVRIVGGLTVGVDAFQPVSDDKVLTRLDAAARAKVKELDLKKFGVKQLPEFPKVFRGVPAVPELFFNDQRMMLARWPNRGWSTIAKIIRRGSVPREGDKSNIPGIFEYADPRPDRWNADHGLWLQGYWCYDWYDETIQVQSIDRATHQITLAAPALYGVSQGNPSARRFRALNLLEELDEPGEFYIDRANVKLYFWMPPSTNGQRATLSILNAPLLSLSNVAHITFRGFTFEAGLANGIQISGGTSNCIENCVIRNMREMGVVVNGGTNHVVAGCDIHDTGTGGIVLRGGDRKTLTPAHHQALNNHIHGFSRHQLTAAYGLFLEGVGNRAAHNVFHDAPHQAVFINGNDHIFEFNVISNVVMETDDAGALYKGRNPSCRGNVIRYNFWKDIGSPMGHGTAAIYFDDGDGGDFVFGNLFLRCGHPGNGSFGTIFSHGGHDLRAENNIFIDCPRALGSAPWDDARWKDAINGGQDCHWQEKLLKEVDITRSPYTTRYPELVGFMDPKPGQPRNSFAKKNILVRCGDISSGNWKYGDGDIWKTDADPGFVNAAAERFDLRPDAEVFKHWPAFQNIPFQQIGITR